MTIADKKALRKECAAVRAAIPPAEKREADGAICRAIRASSLYAGANTLLLYAAIGSEIDLFPLFDAAMRDGKRVAFPRCDKTEKGKMNFYLVRDPADLLPGMYGVREPKEDCPLLTDGGTALCLLPGYAFTPDGFRLGYGGGYYDRFLASFAGISAGVCYDRLILPSLPCEPTDRRAAHLFTERGQIL